MAGRKRKPGRRYPSGDIIPSLPRDEGTPELQARRKAAFGDPRAPRDLNDPVEHLRARLTVEQTWAATEACARYRRYACAIGAPRVVSNTLKDYIEGSRTHPMSADARREAVERYQDAVAAAGRYSIRGLKQVECLMRGGMPRDLASLQSSLQALADHWGFRQARAA